MDKEHYSRSISLDGFGEDGQRKLLNSKVLVVGAGGLGSPTLIYLASTGVGHITIIDSDIINISNLPRQVLYGMDDIGEKKVEVAKEKLESLNKDIKVNAIFARLDETNAIDIIKGHDIVIDCSDNYTTKLLVNDTCLKLDIPFVIAGVSQYDGQVTTCIPHKSKDFRSLFIDKPDDEKIIRSVFPPAIAVVANIATSEAIKYLIGSKDLLLNKLLKIDLLTNCFSLIELPD